MESNGKKIILIVDDSLSIRQSIRVILEKAGYVVREAGSEFGMMNAIDEYGKIVNAILMDITLNQQDGLELVGKLRSTEKHNDIPVIMLTQHSDREHVSYAKSIGVQGYLVKPVQPSVLLDKLRAVL